VRLARVDRDATWIELVDAARRRDREVGDAVTVDVTCCHDPNVLGGCGAASTFDATQSMLIAWAS